MRIERITTWEQFFKSTSLSCRTHSRVALCSKAVNSPTDLPCTRAPMQQKSQVESIVYSFSSKCVGIVDFLSNQKNKKKTKTNSTHNYNLIKLNLYIFFDWLILFHYLTHSINYTTYYVPRFKISDNDSHRRWGHLYTVLRCERLAIFLFSYSSHIQDVSPKTET